MDEIVEADNQVSKGSQSSADEKSGLLKFDVGRLGVWFAGFIAITSGIQQLIETWAEDFGWSSAVSSAFSYGIASAIPAVVLGSLIPRSREAPIYLRGIFWMSCVLPLVVFVSLAFLPVDKAAPLNSVNHLEQSSVVDPDSTQREAIRLMIFPFSAGSISDDEVEITAFTLGMPSLIGSALSRFPDLEVTSRLGRDILSNNGITDLRTIPVSLFGETASIADQDIFLTGSVYKVADNTYEGSLTLRLTWNLKILSEHSFSASESTIFSELENSLARMVSDLSGFLERDIQPIDYNPLVTFASTELEAFKLLGSGILDFLWASNDDDIANGLRKIDLALKLDERFATAWQWRAKILRDMPSTAGQTEAIKASLRNAVRHGDRLALVDYHIARIDYYSYTDLESEKLLKTLKDYKREFPLHRAPREQLIVYFVNYGESESALSELDEFEVDFPEEKAWADRMKGDLLMATGQYQLAIKPYEALLSYTPNDPQILLGLSTAHQRISQYAVAEEYMGQILDIPGLSENPFFLARAANFYRCKGDYERALTLISEAGLWGDSVEEKAYVLTEQTRYFLARGELSSARNSYEALTNLRDGNMYLLGTDYAWLGWKIDAFSGSYAEAQERFESFRSFINSDTNLGSRLAELQLAIIAKQKGEPNSITENAASAKNELDSFLRGADPFYEKNSKKVVDAVFEYHFGRVSQAQVVLESYSQTFLPLLQEFGGEEKARTLVQQRKFGDALEFLKTSAWGFSACRNMAKPLLLEAEIHLAMKELAKASRAVLLAEELLVEADSDFIFLDDLQLLKRRLGQEI